jgi:hypothetical protein
MEYIFVIVGFFVAGLAWGAWEFLGENSAAGTLLSFVLAGIGISLPFLMKSFMGQSCWMVALSFATAAVLGVIATWADTEVEKVRLGRQPSWLARQILK